MYVDIITKAICGKGKKIEHSFHEMDTLYPISNLLGCWVFNHRYMARKEDNTVIIEGAYDINLWYSYNEETKTDIAGATVTYKDEIHVSIDTKNILSEEFNIIVKVLQQPNCTDTSFKPGTNKVTVKTERELLAIIIGETQLKVEAKDLTDPLE